MKSNSVKVVTTFKPAPKEKTDTWKNIHSKSFGNDAAKK